MLGIICKDIYENRWYWLFFAAGISLPACFLYSRPLSPDRQAHIQGFIYGLAVASGMVFAHTLVVSERKRRSLILLKSLPVSDVRIVLAKFTTYYLMSLSLVALPFLVELVFTRSVSLFSWMGVTSAAMLYGTALLACSILFRSLVVLFIPLYIAMGLLIFSEQLATILVRELGQISLYLLPLPAIFVSTGLGTLAVVLFGRKELDF